MAGATHVMAALVVMATLTAATPNLRSTPSRVQPGITQSLTLTCKAQPDTRFVFIDGLTIFFTPDNQPSSTSGPTGRNTNGPTPLGQATPGPAAAGSANRVTLATVMTNLAAQKISNFPGTVNGQLGNGQSESTLKITIENPTNAHVGTYSCQVNGYDHSFNHIDATDTKHVMLESASSTTDLHKKLAEMEKEVKSMKQRWEQVDTTSMFYKSNNTFRGSKYLLSRSQVDHVNLCQFMCTVEGGYLAEVNDEEEFDFVRTFTLSHLRNEQDFPDVFIGASKHGNNDWKFMQNEGRQPYLKWDGYGSNGYDCMILSQNSGYYMNDFDCNEANRFLCEIPL